MRTPPSPTHKWLKALCLLLILLSAVLMVMYGNEIWQLLGSLMLAMWILYVYPLLSLIWLNWRDELATLPSDDTDANTAKHRWLRSPAMSVVLRLSMILKHMLTTIAIFACLGGLLLPIVLIGLCFKN